jgi:hypothetical protein
LGFRRAAARPILASAALLSACVVRDAPPAARTHDARFGELAAHRAPVDLHAACGAWQKTVGAVDPYASSHVSFPETDPDRACYTPVTHAGRAIALGRTPPGCAAPSDAERLAMHALERHLRAEEGPPSALFPCSLSESQKRAAVEHNAEALARAATLDASFPYSAIIVPGFGNGSQASTSIASWLPGDACHSLDELDRLRLGAMVPRTVRAADAWHGGVAPLVIVTGGSPHSPMVEAFAMLFLLECDASAHVPADAVLVEPCAEHTHTNLRNAGRWLVSMGARTGYLVTDDAFQSDYFQDWTGFNLVGGSIDDRSLRDWGYIVGSWRQASVGMDAGFWFTPYRFWGEPEREAGDGLGSFTCVMSDGR